MPAPNWTADNVTEIAILGRWTNSRPCVNVIHVQREEDNARQSTVDVLNNWQDHIMAVVSNNYSIEGARFRDRNVTTGVVGFQGPDLAKNLVGLNSTAAANPNTSFLMHKDGDLVAGQRPGRMYVVGVQEDKIDEDGKLDPTYMGTIDGQMDNFYDGLSGAGSNQLVVVHFQGPGDLTGTSTEVTALRLDPRVATQRRRLRK